MSRPADCQYLPSHEWVRFDGDTATIGITDHAVEALSDLVYLELPEPGTQVRADSSFGEIESVKAVAEINSPVSGEVVERNEDLPDNLDRLNGDAFGAWMIKVRVAGRSEQLLDVEAYERLLEEQG